METLAMMKKMMAWLRKKDVAASVVSHEIKNCVCTLKGNAALLSERVRDPEQRAIVERIARVAEKLESFAMEGGESSSGAADAVHARLRAPVDLVEIAWSCASTHFSSQLERFHWHAPASLPLVVGDANRLEQVFHNLFLNALEAGAERLMVRFHRRKDSVEVVVEDDGPGCGPETLRRLFQPFYSSKKGPGPNGMGLFIVQSIMADHRGAIRVRSKNARGGSAHGLVFTLGFPMLIPLARKGPAPVSRSVPERMAAAA
jgi:C4-dicarboxylate-specific signal transduction histidine kinase